MSEQTQNTNSEVNAPASGGKSSVMGYVIGLIVLAALAAGLWWYMDNNGGAGTGDNNADNTENIQGQTSIETDYPEVVAKVNGEEITGEELNNNVQQTAQTATLQGLDISDEAVVAQIEQQALTTLINTEILLQAAAEAGVTASSDQVEQQIVALQDQLGGESAMSDQMASLGITLDQVRSDMERQLVLNAFIEQNVDTENIEILETDIQAFYDSATAGNEEAPALEDVKGQIIQQLTLQRQQELINEFIEGLRAEANIEILI